MSWQCDPKVRGEPLQVWRLHVPVGSTSGIVQMFDGNNREPKATQKVPYTDFPMSEITLYLEQEGISWMLMLPSER